MNIKKVLSSVGVGAAAIILGLGIQYTLADWTAPQSAPPTCVSGNPGCDAPINVGPSAQAKTGLLALENLAVNYLNVASGTIAAGNVLTSDANGNAGWAKPSGGIGQGISCPGSEVLTGVSSSGAPICKTVLFTVESYAGGSSQSISLGAHTYCAVSAVDSSENSQVTGANNGTPWYLSSTHPTSYQGAICVDVAVQ